MLLTQVIIAGLAALATAHPGHEEAELAHAIKARANTQSTKRALENCAAKLAERGVTARSVERRSATLAKHRAEKRIDLKCTSWSTDIRVPRILEEDHYMLGLC